MQEKLKNQAWRQQRTTQGLPPSLSVAKGDDYLMGEIHRFDNEAGSIQPEQNAQGFKQPVLDDIERLSNSNEMVENIICTLSNISRDHTLHQELIHNGLIDVIKGYIRLFLKHAKQENDLGIDETVDGIQLLQTMPTGSVQLIKSLSQILLNISQNPAIQMQCMNHGIIQLMKDCMNLKDYEVHTNLYKSLGNFLISKEQDIRKKMVHSGILQEFLESHECSQYFRIKRICSEYLNKIAQFDPQLFDLNDAVQHRRMQQELAMANGANTDLQFQQPSAM